MVQPVKITSSSNNNIFCNNKIPITLSASGADIYKWSTHEDGASIKINTNGYFSVQGINLNGCSDTSATYINIQIAHSTQTVRICEGDSFNGHTTSGTYADTLKTATGCDSLKILNLIVETPYLFNEDHSICKGETYFWHGKSYSTANTYSANYKSVGGCDSTYTLNLKVYPIFNSTESYSICNGETYHWHGKNYSVPNTYTETYTTTKGCDSSFTLILHVNSVDTNILQNGNTLTATSNADTYQWVNCDNNFHPITGEVNQIFTASSNGSYAVILKQYNCIDTSTCFQITGTSIASFQNNSIASIYPNPIANELIIEMKRSSNQEITFEIFNAMGQVLETGHFKNRIIVRTSKFPVGVYLIKIKDGDIYYFNKVVKE